MFIISVVAQVTSKLTKLDVKVVLFDAKVKRQVFAFKVTNNNALVFFKCHNAVAEHSTLHPDGNLHDSHSARYGKDSYNKGVKGSDFQKGIFPAIKGFKGAREIQRGYFITDLTVPFYQLLTKPDPREQIITFSVSSYQKEQCNVGFGLYLVEPGQLQLLDNLRLDRKGEVIQRYTFDTVSPWVSLYLEKLPVQYC